MSAPENLDDIYEDELRDLWSANDQMKRIVAKLVKKASDAKLTQMLEKSVGGIEKHTDMLKGLLDDIGGKKSREHCKGMEGLCAEATKHAIDEDIDDGDVRDVIIIAQYQRMSHYGIAGFGTAKAYAEALGLKDHVKQLDAATADIYGADEAATMLAEKTANLKAK